MNIAVMKAPKNATRGRTYTNEPPSVGKNRKKIAIATPAPELIPIIPGSAKSFLVTVCKMDPDRLMPSHLIM